MNNWTSGYVADIDYTYGYYIELNPLRANLALARRGFVCPEFNTACELGFGQGLSANLHAAGSSIEWHGTDFNPSQAGFAIDLASHSSANVQLRDDAFADYCARDDLPEFDFIGLHGIWSWISDENRKVIIDFIDRKLRVGGVLYMSYNTLPGWASFGPMRHLMNLHTEIVGAEGKGIVGKIDEAIEFASQLLATEPMFGRANPLVSDRIKKMQDQNRHYLAHEFFNRDWQPMHFAEVSEWLQQAKMSYACSAHYLDHIDSVNILPKQQEFYASIPDGTLKQSVRDFLTNQQFRRDYWIKGPRTMSDLERAELLQSHRVILIADPQDIELTAKGAQGEATLNAKIYKPIINVLKSYQVMSIGDILRQVQSQGIDLGQAVQSIMVLADKGHVVSVQSDQRIEHATQSAQKLNQRIMKNARSGAEIQHLTSPVSGGGIPVHRFEQIFISAILLGEKDPNQWADTAWALMKLQGQKLVVNEKAVTTEKESIEELRKRATKFAEKRMKVLQALKVIP